MDGRMVRRWPGAGPSRGQSCGQTRDERMAARKARRTARSDIWAMEGERKGGGCAAAICMAAPGGSEPTRHPKGSYSVAGFSAVRRYAMTASTVAGAAIRLSMSGRTMSSLPRHGIC